jgi:hypothetical protein
MGIEIVRRSDSGDLAGEVKSIAVPYSGSFTSHSVTAVITKSGNLRLIDWHVDASGKGYPHSRLGHPGGAGVRDQHRQGRTSLIRHRRAVRLGEASRDQLERRLQHDLAARGQRQFGGRSRPDSDCPPRQKQLRQLGPVPDRLPVGVGNASAHHVEGGPGQDVSAARNGRSRRGVGDLAGPVFYSFSVEGSLVATTVRAGNGSALSIVWEVSADGSTITRRGDSGNQMGLATKISSMVTITHHLVVSCRASNGNLRLITLQVSSDGNTVTRVGDSGSQAGAVSGVSSIFRKYGLLTAVRAGDGHLLLIAWNINSGGALTRGGDSADQAGAADLITLDSTGQPNAAVLTSVRTASGTLKLITWDDGAGIN